ncbi:MAG: hypothetical protein DSY80_02520 [Desulfocapsa sp.]|nr:MAG: hypothetical protein DSY80_02520 [Desulfocapsa sp.]
MSGYWRDIARPIIAEVIANNKGGPMNVTKKALFDAYPFNERKYYSYKVWLNEIKKQLPKTKLDAVPKNQLTLF